MYLLQELLRFVFQFIPRGCQGRVERVVVVVVFFRSFLRRIDA